jgi:hypothetical protein
VCESLNATERWTVRTMLSITIVCDGKMRKNTEK